MKRYDNYKSSEIDWIGEIPSHWKPSKVKYIGDYINGCAFKPTEWIDENIAGKPIIRIQNLNNDLAKYNYFLGEKDERFLVKFEDILISWSASLGVYIWKGQDAWLNQHIFKVDNIKTDKAFFVWIAKKFIEEISHKAHGSTMEHLTKDAFGSFELFIPPLSEQTAIAKYLDEKTEQIDRLIAGKRRLIELLKEERTAIINQAVTKGINEHAKHKFSGIDWLGDIPEHWEVVPINYRFEVQLGKMLDEKRITGKHLAPYLRNVDVQWSKINLQDLPEMDFSEDDRKKYSLRFGDLLVCEGGEIGRCAIWKNELSECFYQKALHRIRPLDIDRSSTDFMFYLMFVATKRGLFSSTGNSSTIEHLPAEKLRKHRFPFAPIEEQKQIVSYIEVKTKEVEKTISKVEKEIELLQEYRTALISEVVTGKMKVV